MRKIFINTIAVVSAITAIVYFASCLTPYISPLIFWPMSFLALGYPYLAVAIILLAIVWLFIKRKVSLYLFALLFVGIQNLTATFTVNIPSDKSPSKDTAALRVLTWNVRGFDNPTITRDSASSIRSKMLDYIANTKADILCLQEFTEHNVPGTFSNTRSLQQMGYKYFYRTDESFQQYDYGTIQVGSAIFSKVPILHAGKTMLGDTTYPEHLAYVDVALQNKTVRIYSSHFKSINLFAVPNTNPNRVIFYGDSNFVYYGSKFEKLKAFGKAHAREALIANETLNKSPYPFVLGVDMNSVPTSYAYHKVAEGLQDAFKEKGYGLGTTMIDLPKTLRIDFLLVDRRLTIKQYVQSDVHLSDHYPQYIDVTWKK